MTGTNDEPDSRGVPDERHGIAGAPGTAPRAAPAAEREHGLHPAVQVGWVVGRVINATFLGAMAVFGEASLDRWLPLQPPLFGVSVFVAALLLGLWHARVQFTRWRWSLCEDDVVARFGVIWRVRRSIPRVRVQHVDVSSGPIDRALGLVEVSLHVAGSAGAVLTIPGLAPAEAETLREALLDSAKVP